LPTPFCHLAQTLPSQDLQSCAESAQLEMEIYLAGPDVFLHDAVEIGRRKVEMCRRHGLIGLYPLDNAI
jgi:hypothetical protein